MSEEVAKASVNVNFLRSLKVSIVLPFTPEESSLFKVSVAAVHVDRSSSSSSSSSADRTSGSHNSNSDSRVDPFLSKDVQLKSVCARLMAIPCPRSERDLLGTLEDSGVPVPVAAAARRSNHNKGGNNRTGNSSSNIQGTVSALSGSATTHMLVNSCNLLAVVVAHEEPGSSQRAGNNSSGGGGGGGGGGGLMAKLNVLMVRVSMSNLELSPTTAQLAMLSDNTLRLREAKLRYKFQSIRHLTQRQRQHHRPCQQQLARAILHHRNSVHVNCGGSPFEQCC